MILDETPLTYGLNHARIEGYSLVDGNTACGWAFAMGLLWGAELRRADELARLAADLEYAANAGGGA